MADNTSKFVIENGVLIKYNGNDENVFIPQGVKVIAPFVFYKRDFIKSVEMPLGLFSIGNAAFFGCKNLKNVLMPGWLYKDINGKGIFDNERSIFFRFYVGSNTHSTTHEGGGNGEAIYQVVKERTFIQPDGTNNSADNVQLTVIKGDQKAPEVNVVSDKRSLAPNENNTNTLNNSAISYDFSDFYTTKKLPVGQIDYTVDSIEFVDEKVIYDSPDDLEGFNDDVEIVDDYIDDRTLRERINAVEKDNTVKKITVSAKTVDYSDDFIIDRNVLVKYVGSDTEVFVPENIEVIGCNAFSNTNVETVVLPDGITRIDGGAFAWCEKLKNINLPNSLQIIDDDAFADCSALEHIDLPHSLRYIGANAFHACSAIKQIKLPNSITAIARRAFDFCISLEEVEVPYSIKVLSEGIFSHCEGLKKVILPNDITEIGNWAFADCVSLKEINLPSTIKKIGDVAFINCRSLVEISVPHSVTSFGRQVFVGCDSLVVAFLPVHLEGQVRPSKVFNGLKKLQVNYFDLA